MVSRAGMVKVGAGVSLSRKAAFPLSAFSSPSCVYLVKKKFNLNINQRRWKRCLWGYFRSCIAFLPLSSDVNTSVKGIWRILFQAIAKPFAMYLCIHMHTFLAWAVTFLLAWTDVSVVGSLASYGTSHALQPPFTRCHRSFSVKALE